MSHFCVIVVGPNPEEQLAPYHEFECTGEDDKYVKNVNITRQVRKEYEKHTKKMYRDQEGKLHDPYENRFYRDPLPGEDTGMGGTGWNGKVSYTSRDWEDGKGYRAKVHFLPEGWSEIEVPTKDTQTFAEFAADWHGYEIVPFGQKPDLEKKHKYGYVQLAENGEVARVVDRTNPNRKWDWYVTGGRWTGWLKLKAGAKGKLGRPGLMTDPARDGFTDQTEARNVDWAGMQEEDGERARRKYRILLQACGGTIAKLKYEWETLLNDKRFKGLDIEDKRFLYHNQPPMLAFKKAVEEARGLAADKELSDSIRWAELSEFQCTEEEYVARARAGAITPFAIVKDGKWYQRGEMGWWGVVHNESNRGEWEKQVAELLTGLPEDTQLTVIDCHI